MRLTLPQSTSPFPSTGFLTWFALNSRQMPSTRCITYLPEALHFRGRPAIRSCTEPAASKSASLCLRRSATFDPNWRLACSSASHVLRSDLEANANTKLVFLDQPEPIPRNRERDFFTCVSRGPLSRVLHRGCGATIADAVLRAQSDYDTYVKAPHEAHLEEVATRQGRNRIARAMLQGRSRLHLTYPYKDRRLVQRYSAKLVRHE
jgi:hypothetical protein